MNSAKHSYVTIDEYISLFPREVQQTLHTLKKLCREEIPDAEEAISYGVPTFKRNGKYVVYFAGFKNHISLYPITTKVEETFKEAAKYRAGKGTMQFKLDQPLPFPLIRKIVKVLVEEHKARTGSFK